MASNINEGVSQTNGIVVPYASDLGTFTEHATQLLIDSLTPMCDIMRDVVSVITDDFPGLGIREEITVILKAEAMLLSNSFTISRQRTDSQTGWSSSHKRERQDWTGCGCGGTA